MVPLNSYCFVEDAACVIIREDAVRSIRSAGCKPTEEQCNKEPSLMDRLLLFLGRSLVLTRRTLYVLLCVTSNATSSSYDSVGGDDPCGDAAGFVSCGPEAWRLIVCLSTKLWDLARRLEVQTVPIVLPWMVQSQSPAHVEANDWAPHWSHCVLKARTAVIRHYVLTARLNLWWPAMEDAELATAVPLIVDDGSFTDKETCAIWPRHCHLSPLYTDPPTYHMKDATPGIVVNGHSSHDAASTTPEGMCNYSASSRHAIHVNGHIAKQEDVVEVPTVTAGFTGSAEDKKDGPGFKFKYTVVAGTFDRLHGGHQLLLAAAMLASSDAVGLAVTSGPMLEKKAASPEDAAAAGIEPFAYRLHAAAAFLQLVGASAGRELSIRGFREAIQEEHGSVSAQPQFKDPDLGLLNTFSTGLEALPPVVELHSSTRRAQLQIFRITDPVGPADRLAFDCLVASPETLKGAHAVNSIRKRLGYDPVFVLTVEIVPIFAEVAPHIAATLTASLPSFLNWKGRLDETESSVESSTEAEARADNVVQADRLVAGDANGDAYPLVFQVAAESSGNLVEASRRKLGSTELRKRQLSCLRCRSIVWLYTRFKAAWKWLVGSLSGEQVASRESSAVMWRLLCAEHAVPWRRLHTLSRLERALKRLDEVKSSARSEPVVLCLFLGSLLASPCRYISLKRVSSPGYSCSSQAEDHCVSTCTAATWSCDLENEAWERSVRGLVAEIKLAAKATPTQAQGQINGPSSVGSASPGSVGLEERCALLTCLLWKQRAASLATLAPASNIRRTLHENTLEDRADWERGELVRVIRRLEQLECTGSAVMQATQLRNLREEYFFVEAGIFTRCRALQLQELLTDTSTFDCLKFEEVQQARANVEHELKALSNDDSTTC
ncbi:uncharacterized protein LOC34620975 [Cyclospora cayetanensis]|uniref:Uncharacterized protein LOC34620975 n=2 Tax=Cyclospora cayetanensis TaxID=88456 RepID=A0A6P5WCF3_9EIME|nr:uncharacterized protein LOC34620975 [Cyclospora cayetanensis]OEH73670.1 hypothetical protein cyc_04441 [Cyclospora cayetanensis]